LMPLHLDFQEKLGNTYLALEYLPQAKKVFDFVLKENPKREMALCNRGYIAALEGDWATSEKLYDQAIALNPDYEQAILNKAALYMHLKKKDKAERLLKSLRK
ncbi:MAG TPA: tetratricopeptide repeat protein, partial [Phaeodactylibacter sp.]|nr:tetratricopeptide repeat protein [Phaeodactylibacter sp.]